MKTIIYLLSLYFIFNISLFAQGVIEDPPPTTQLELYLENNSIYTAIVQVYPISSVINGDNEYSLIAKEPNDCSEGIVRHRYNYICGVRYENDTKFVELTLYPGQFNWGFNYDCEGVGGPPCAGNRGTFGRGIYKIVYRYSYESNYIQDSVIFELDAGSDNDLCIQLQNDLSVYGGSSGPGLTYQMTLNTTEWGPKKPVSFTYGFIKMWDPYPYIPELWRRDKEYGDFKYSNGTSMNNPYNLIPIDCRIYSNILTSTPEQNHIFPYDYNSIINDERQGIITLNVSVKKNIHTPNIFWFGNLLELEHPIIINSGARLEISDGISDSNKLTMNPYSDNIHGTKMLIKPNGTLYLKYSQDFYHRAIVEIQNKCEINAEPSSHLSLGANSNIEIKNGGKLYLQQGSVVRALGNSKITVYPGGTYCNYGAYVTGILHVEYIGHPYTFCANYASDYFFDDSTQITLKDSAVLTIPDSSTVYFRNPESSLYLDSNSTILMGKNSKLVFKDGAKLFANKSKFKCSDSTSTWDGIYLEDYSTDTIKYCLIENAINGINIKDRGTSEEFSTNPSTEISNCTFRNLTNSSFTSEIYLLNSNNVLIQNNTFESPNNSLGFSIGITVEYCPSGNINVINNNIDYVSTGIVVIQSSPYISRNSIVGQANANYGLYLDNSNCIIKNNTVSNFNNSINLNYSSPNLFRNILNNSSESNIMLQTYSTPLMCPITSGSELSWFGGNNQISGYPVNTGIKFCEESYPEMNDGNNIENVNGSNYMEGSIPYFLEGNLIANNNFWGDEPPDEGKFVTPPGRVTFKPSYDGITPIDFDNYDLQDIGFSLYDTILTKNFGQSPRGNLLFMQAYKKEKQKDFVTAISLYKQVITSFKKSYFAIASIERIFNCLEKSRFNIVNFTTHQNYLNQIRNNDNYPLILKELAEDYIIKCKIKRRLLNNALADYQQMYEENQNNSKGHHAFLNKECVLAMLIDTSRNSMMSQFAKLNLHKLNLSAIINKKSLNTLALIDEKETPRIFQLYQNYPNPFNPVTNIKYELPKDIFVSIKIYDILGREINTLVNDFQRTGQYTVSFNGSNLASGVYFYRIQAGEYVNVKRMLMIK